MVCELFNTLADIFEAHTVFDKMFVVLEDLIEERKQASKVYDEVTDWQRYMKDKPDNITLLTNFQFKRARTILRDLEDLDETIAEAIKKAQAICDRRWYAVDNIMTELSFPTMVLIEKACPPRLMIEQVYQQRDDQDKKIMKLDHISRHDVDMDLALYCKWLFD